jgi:hypothetical protein
MERFYMVGSTCIHSQLCKKTVPVEEMYQIIALWIRGFVGDEVAFISTMWFLTRDLSTVYGEAGSTSP